MNTSKQNAFTLIEYLVATTIGLILLAGFTTLFIGMKQSFSAQSSLSQLQENGRFALYYLTNDIQNAGWTEVTDKVNGIGDTTLPYIVAGSGNTSDDDDIDTSDEINVRYEAGFDCLGNAAPADGIVSNHYYIDDGQLLCEGSSGNPQPLITGVEALHFLYGVDTDSDVTPNKFVRASQLAAAEYEQISAVKVILLLASEADVHQADTEQTFSIIGETGEISKNDKKIRKLFSTTINIPNQPIFGGI